MIAMVYDDLDEPRLYGQGDLPWIGRLLDVVEEARGQPWRAMLARVEAAPLGVQVSDRTAMLRALRRIAGSRRNAQLLAASVELTWFDVLVDRPVALPHGRPTEAELAAHANLERIQRVVRRAHDLQIRVWSRARDLIRAATQHGLIVEARSDGASTQLDLVGPLGLLHATMVYGRALAGLIPLLAEHPRFELDVRCQLRGEETFVRIVSPVLLPAPIPAPRAVTAPEHLARDLADRGYAVEYEPPAIAVGPQRLFPDLAVTYGGARWLIELLAFSTPDTVARKLAAYRRAQLPAVLCVESSTALACELDPRVCDYRREVDVDQLLASFEAAR